MNARCHFYRLTLPVVVGLVTGCGAGGDDADSKQQENVCRKAAEGRIKAMCPGDVKADGTPAYTKANEDEIVNACLHPKCLASSSGGSVPCSSSCTAAKIALADCADGQYYCSDTTDSSVPYYRCDDYEKRQHDYQVACL